MATSQSKTNMRADMHLSVVHIGVPHSPIWETFETATFYNKPLQKQIIIIIKKQTKKN